MATPSNSVFPKNRNFITADFLAPKTDSVGPKTSIEIKDDPASGVGVTYIEFDSENKTLNVDVISEYTSAAGVTIDGVLLKDSEVSTDVINEKTSDAGVTADGVLLKDNAVSASGLVTSETGLRLDDNTQNPDTWTLQAQAVSTTELVVSSSGTRNFDVKNSGAGAMNFKVDGTTLGVPFMATHRRLLGDTSLKEGEAVKLNTEGRLIRCTEACDPMCDGLYTSEIVSVEEYPDGHLDSFRQLVKEDIHHVACLGNSRSEYIEGAFLCNENGPILPGDLLCTANKPGFLMKQDSPSFCNYTVGQYRLPRQLEFDENGEAFDIYIYLFRG